MDGQEVRGIPAHNEQGMEGDEIQRQTLTGGPRSPLTPGAPGEPGWPCAQEEECLLLQGSQILLVNSLVVQGDQGDPFHHFFLLFPVSTYTMRMASHRLHCVGSLSLQMVPGSHDFLVVLYYPGVPQHHGWGKKLHTTHLCSRLPWKPLYTLLSLPPNSTTRSKRSLRSNNTFSSLQSKT